MTHVNYKDDLLTIRERHEDGDLLDNFDINYLFKIIDILEAREKGLCDIIRKNNKD